MKPFLKRKKILIIVIVGVTLVLSLNFFSKEVRGFFYSFSSPIQKSFWGVGNSISGFFEGLANTGKLKKENDDLKLTIEQLLAENMSLQETKKENEFLREALEIGLPKEFRLALAEVISKDINQDCVLIDLGAKDGLLEGMPVITQQKTLLGKIIEVYDSFSRVMLISHQESSFDAGVVDSNITGVIKGKGSFEIEFDLVPKDEEVVEGDLIVSSALGGLYPQGLLVGQVKKIEQSDIQPFYQIEVSPFFDLPEIDKVFVALNF